MTKIAYTEHTGLNSNQTYYDVVVFDFAPDGTLTEVERRPLLGSETYGVRPQTPAGDDYWLGGWAMYGQPTQPATLEQQTVIAKWRSIRVNDEGYRQVHRCVVEWGGVGYERTQELSGVKLPAYRNL